MPKIIENPEARIIAGAKHLAETEGYNAVTIRAVASGSGMGVGTVYNYFPSKDDLLAALLLSEWQKCVDTFQAACDAAEDPKDALLVVYEHMRLFGQRHQTILFCPETVAAFLAPGSPYNELLLRQITQSVRRFCDSDYTTSFIARSLLNCTLFGDSFEDLYSVLKKLF